MPPEKLLSCPFCGSNNKRPVVQKTLCVRPYIVMCFQCFAQTSEYNTEEAMFAWNTRPPSPELVELGKLSQEITEYFVAGGLFNPEMMEHNKVSKLLYRIRATIDAAKEK